MKKKFALVMTSLLVLTALLTTPLYLQETTVEAQPPPPWHWKIMLAQKGCNARIVGNLTQDGAYIPGSDFDLVCICELPEPQPLGQFVFAKIPTPVEANDITYTKYIDVDKDGLWDIVEPIINAPFYPTPPPDEPHTWYQHVEEDIGPLGPWMVVVEVREQPYYEERPFFEWQLMIKQHNVNTLWTGTLTDELGDPIPGTGFNILCECTTLQCQVVRTPYCTVPHDIDFNIQIFSKDGPLIDDQIHHEIITQFPWTMVKSGIDPYTGKTWRIELELTEVQMHRYILMGGEAENCAQLGVADPMFWNVPYATRAPYYTPLQEQSLNITFTQRDPITGIVKLGVPAESYVGINHVFYGPPTNQYYNVSTLLREQGCGYLFTGLGKDPILGDVDIITWNNDTGIYSDKTGQLIELGPCLQDISGPDGIPGTGDPGDIFGDGTPDGIGSSVLYLNTIVHSDYENPKDPCTPPTWKLLYEAPYPNLFTTATASDTVVEDQSDLNGLTASASGEPWEFLAGLDHPEYNVTWKHPKCNAYVTCANAWSLLNIPTSLGNLDLLWHVTNKLVREDCVIADIDCNEETNLYDIVKIGIAYGAKDETWCRPNADPNYDARADLKPEKGVIDLYDLVRCAIDYGAKLTPDCIIRP